MTEPGDIEEACPGCRFFDEFGGKGYGQCRRNAPVPHNQKDDEDFERLHVWWPEVYEADWCGEFQFRTDRKGGHE